MRKPISQKKSVVCIIENFTHRKILEKEIERVVQHTIRDFSQAGKKKLAVPHYIYIYVAGVVRSARLNKKFCGIEKPTDVLSFESPAKDGTRMLIGEIVLCPEVVERHAKKLRRPFQNEWAHVLVHGTLHVLGHHHEESAVHERELRKKENTICKTLGYGMPHPEIKFEARNPKQC